MAERKPVEMDPTILAGFPKVMGSSGRMVRSTTPNLDILRESPTLRSMAMRIADTAMSAPSDAVEAGRQFYARERSRLLHVGSGFNESRAQRGMPTYFEDQPEVAGALLTTQFSQNTNEKRRHQLVEHARTTGEILPHLATGRINSAIAEGKHPMDLVSEQYGGEGLKLYDFTGSSMYPETWKGEWGGRQRGLGYTIDRHSHDIAMGHPFGNSERGLNTMRYRTHQVAHLLAHEAVGSEFPGLSRAQFQAIPWVGWRGTHDLLD